MQIAMADAKARFADLIRRVEAGEVVVITRYGKPVAELRAGRPEASLPLFGALKGQIEISEDFDVLPGDFIAAMTAPIEPQDAP